MVDPTLGQVRYSLKSLLIMTTVMVVVLAIVAYIRSPRLAADVSARIDADFAQDRVHEVRAILLNYDATASRMHRCMLHLAEGDLEKLKQVVADAHTDYRDVILAAEYESNPSGWAVNRVRDFNRSFQDASRHPFEP